MREKCPCSEFFWSVFSHIWAKYGEILRIFPYSVQMRENTDQKSSECGHFSRSVYIGVIRSNILLSYKENYIVIPECLLLHVRKCDT